MVMLKQILGYGHCGAPKAETVAPKKDKRFHAPPKASYIKKLEFNDRQGEQHDVPYPREDEIRTLIGPPGQ